MNKFELGKIVITYCIKNLIDSNTCFVYFLYRSLERYKNCDWGDTCDEDWHVNNEAINNGDRILAVYTSQNIGITIWIITESDRSVTTILLPEEY